jgi:hypothetical protein
MESRVQHERIDILYIICQMILAPVALVCLFILVGQMI